jgi:transcriptional regulator with XRE-family HTH domain
MGNELSTRIKECMSKMGINNEQLASECGVKPPTSFNWASGKTKKIKAEPLLKAAKLFGVTPEWLGNGEQPKYPSDGTQASISEPTRQYLPPQIMDKMTAELVSLFNKLDKPSKHEYLGQLRGFVMGCSMRAKDPPSEQTQPANNERTGTHN